jgi:phosphoglycolate phosphatase-like HAD superfamily hydrolase
VERGRPFPDLIFRATELTHIKDAKNVAKVGDTASDMQEGNAAGCGLVVGVTTGAFSRKDLEMEKHTHLIENVQELLEILEIDID